MIGKEDIFKNKFYFNTVNAFLLYTKVGDFRNIHTHIYVAEAR